MRLISVILASGLAFAAAQRNLDPTWVTLRGENGGLNIAIGDNRPYLEPIYLNGEVDTVEDCQATCEVGCDYVVYKFAQDDRNVNLDPDAGDIINADPLPVGTCQKMRTDKTDNTQTFFVGQEADRPVYGEILSFVVAVEPTIMADTTQAACLAACTAEVNPCYFITYDFVTNDCHYKAGFWDAPGFETSFRSNPDVFNSDPAALGRFDEIGNTGIVCTHATLMPDSDEIVCGNRPEYYRGGYNTDNILADSPVIYGEIASVFNYVTGTSRPSHIVENIFCHGMTLTSDGGLFSAGGDNGLEQIGVPEFLLNWLPAATGLDLGELDDEGEPLANVAITTMHSFNLADNEWTLIDVPIQPRWYPTVVRRADNCFMMLGGQASARVEDGIFSQASLETYCLGDDAMEEAEPIPVPVMMAFVGFLDDGAGDPDAPGTNSPNYPHLVMIPGGNGNFFMLVLNVWNIVSGVNGAILLTDPLFDEYPANKIPDVSFGMRGNTLPAGAVMMPIATNAAGVATSARFMIFGGGVGADLVPNDAAVLVLEPLNGDISLNTVKSMDLFAGDLNNRNSWEWEDEDPMPHGRLTSNAILQPNGKVCLFGGWQRGITGGNMGGNIPAGFENVQTPGDDLLQENIAGVPGLGTATDTFCYDGSQPTGQRWTVHAWSLHRRHYHSTALLLPNGTTVVMGCDQATYETREASPYQHIADMWTPPWLLDGTDRPVIDSFPRRVQFNTQFSITYSGAPVTTACLMAPGSNTHGTEMNQRMVWLFIVVQTDDTLTFFAPADATVILAGDNMLFVNNGDTSSSAVWLELTNDEVVYPTFDPTVDPTVFPTVVPTEIPTVEPTVLPTTLVPTDVPTAAPSAMPTTMSPSAIPTAIPSESPTSEANTSSDGLSGGALAGIVVGGILFLIALLLLVLFLTGYFRKNSAPGYEMAASSQIEMLAAEERALDHSPTIVIDGIYVEHDISTREISAVEHGSLAV